MKQFLFSWLLVFGLALLGQTGYAANTWMDQHANSSQQQQQQAVPPSQNAPPPNSGAPVIRQNQRTEPNQPPSSGVLVKPSGVLNVPSGVLQKPSGVLFKPPGTVSTLPGENHAPRQNFIGSQGDFRRSHSGGDSGHGDFHRHGHRTSLIVVYVNGSPCWYPVATAYPYYYDAPLPPTYDSGYSGNSPYVPMVDDTTGGVEAESNYAEAGSHWGQDLRREVASWDQFVDYLKNYIVGASPAAQADFREAFIGTYGVNGAAAYDKAAEQAVRSTTPSPKVINLQSGY